jgi:hypothetical protein
MKTELNTIIKREDALGLIKLLESPDPENHIVAFSILEECNYLLSYPWLIVLFKESDTLFSCIKELPKLNNFLEQYIDTDQKLSINNAYKLLRTAANSEDAIKYMIEEKFADTMSNQLFRWGFEFIIDYKLTITPINDNTRQ